MRSSGGYGGQYPDQMRPETLRNDPLRPDPMRTSGGYNANPQMGGPPMYPQGMPYGGPNQMYGTQFMPPGYPHPYMPPGQPTSTYPVGMQQYPQPMYQQPGMYQGYQNQWPPGVAPPPHLPPGAPYNPTSQPMAQTHTTTANMYSPPGEYPDNVPQSPHELGSPVHRSSPDDNTHSPDGFHSPDGMPMPHSPPSERPEAQESHEVEDEANNPASPASQHSTPANKGFFVAFETDSVSPRKQKPKLPSSRRKESSSSPVRKEVVPPPITAKPDGMCLFIIFVSLISF